MEIEPRNKSVSSWLKRPLYGALIGAVAGVLCGGICSSLFGQPFSGLTGLRVFHLGMVFPGLIIIAPVTTGIGAVLGIVLAGDRKTPPPRR